MNVELTVNHEYRTVRAQVARMPVQADPKDGVTSWHPTTATYDAIVIGAGHNGLINGAYLAKAGLRT